MNKLLQALLIVLLFFEIKYAYGVTTEAPTKTILLKRSIRSRSVYSNCPYGITHTGTCVDDSKKYGSDRKIKPRGNNKYRGVSIIL